jgi:hypothetical protein
MLRLRRVNNNYLGTFRSRGRFKTNINLVMSESTAGGKQRAYP